MVEMIQCDDGTNTSSLLCTDYTTPCYATYCIVANSLSGSTLLRRNATYVVSYLGILYNSGFHVYDVNKILYLVWMVVYFLMVRF